MSMFTLTLSAPLPLHRNFLNKVKMRAVRRGVWFKALSTVERNIIDLTIRVVDKVRSRTLTRILSDVLKKLLPSLESRISRLIREIGLPLAYKLSSIAESWGNRNAKLWMYDLKFAVFLAVKYTNVSPLYRFQGLTS